MSGPERPNYSDLFKSNSAWLTQSIQKQVADLIEFFKHSDYWTPCAYCEKPVLYQYVTDGMRDYFGFTEDFYTTDLDGYRHHCYFMEEQDKLRKTKLKSRKRSRKMQRKSDQGKR